MPMVKYPWEHEEAGRVAKLVGILFILVGGYALVNLYGIFSINLPFSSGQVLIAVSIGSIIGGIYMLTRSGNRRYR